MTRFPLFVLCLSLVFLLFVPFGCDSIQSSFNYPGHPTNWIIRAGGSFGSDSDATPGAPYLSMKYYPADVEIFYLDTVTWVFLGKEPHTVSFIHNFTVPFNPLDSGIFALQQQVGFGYFDNFTSADVSSGLRAEGAMNYTLWFNQTGNFPYLCAIHPSMLGTVRVRDWNQTLGKTAEDVLSQGNDELSADSNYALGDFIKQANLLGPVPYTEDSDGYRTWTVWEGVAAQPPDSNVTGVGPISAYDFFPGNGVFNITAGDRIKFLNADELLHTLAIQTNSTFIPFEAGHYKLTYIPDAEANLTYAGGFQDYGTLIPFDPLHNNKTITFSEEGTYYAFCTLHSDMGMFAQINVMPENESEGNETTTGPSSTGGSGGIGGSSGTHGGQSSTGTHPIQSSTGVGGVGTGGTGGTGGNNGGNNGGTAGSRNSAPASAISHPAMMLVISLFLGAALMI